MIRSSILATSLRVLRPTSTLTTLSRKMCPNSRSPFALSCSMQLISRLQMTVSLHRDNTFSKRCTMKKSVRKRSKYLLQMLRTTPSVRLHHVVASLTAVCRISRTFPFDFRSISCRSVPWYTTRWLLSLTSALKYHLTSRHLTSQHLHHKLLVSSKHV